MGAASLSGIRGMLTFQRGHDPQLLDPKQSHVKGVEAIHQGRELGLPRTHSEYHLSGATQAHTPQPHMLIPGSRLTSSERFRSWRGVESTPPLKIWHRMVNS